MIASIVDTLIIVLLAGSIGYGYLISKKVQTLMSVLRNIEPLVKEYSDAVDKSESSVLRMKDHVETAQRTASETEGQDDAPVLRSAQTGRARFPGMQRVSDKKELVRMFFDTSRTESGT